jgi:hypothetical protein
MTVKTRKTRSEAPPFDRHDRADARDLVRHLLMIRQSVEEIVEMEHPNLSERAKEDLVAGAVNIIAKWYAIK